MKKEKLLSMNLSNWKEILNQLELNVSNNIEIYYITDKNKKTIVFDCFFEDAIVTIEKFFNKVKVKLNEEVFNEFYL